MESVVAQPSSSTVVMNEGIAYSASDWERIVDWSAEVSRSTIVVPTEW
jgi:hypothetical protein